MSSEPRYHPGADMQGFVRELMELSGWTMRTWPHYPSYGTRHTKHEQAITAALQNTFSNSATARFFLKKDDGT
jgi:hypothetical protein